MPHAVNWYAGWLMILVGFVIGAAQGLGFHRPDFLGGYASWRRRLLRLGHIALVALGLFNEVYGISPAVGSRPFGRWPGYLFIAGGIAMPISCFLAAWRQPLRRLFFIPVSALIAAVVLVLLG